MKYRDHAGSLADSMETVQEVSTIEQIKQHLNKFFNQFGKSVAEIKFKYDSFDNRINWDTYYVLQRLEGENDFTVAGMSDGCLCKNCQLCKPLYMGCDNCTQGIKKQPAV